jgi:hypothetical protein
VSGSRAICPIPGCGVMITLSLEALSAHARTDHADIMLHPATAAPRRSPDMHPLACIHPGCGRREKGGVHGDRLFCTLWFRATEMALKPYGSVCDGSIHTPDVNTDKMKKGRKGLKHHEYNTPLPGVTFDE